MCRGDDWMAAELRAIEVTGTVDEEGHLSIDEPLRALAPGRVRLIVLTPERTASGRGLTDDPDEREWLAAAARNSAFAFLGDEAEDIYSIQDGQPFDDQG